MAISVNTGSWYRVLGQFVLGNDACIGIWLRLPNGITPDDGFNFPMSSGTGGNAPSTARFAAWGLATGSPRSFVTAIYDDVGDGIFDYDWTLPAPAGVVDNWHLLVINKVGINVNTYWTPLGGEATQVGTGNSVETLTTLQGMYLGRTDELDSGEHNWRNELAEFFVLDRMLTVAEITELASGKNIAAVEPAAVINLPFRDAGAIETDLSGNGYNATRTGTPLLVDHPFALPPVDEVGDVSVISVSVAGVNVNGVTVTGG